MPYVPTIGEQIPVHLPYETIRADVIHVFNEDEIAVNLSVRPFAKNHDYRENDWVRCVRTPATVSGDVWEAMGRLEKPPQTPEPEPTGKRRGRP